MDHKANVWSHFRWIDAPGSASGSPDQIDNFDYATYILYIE